MDFIPQAADRTLCYWVKIKNFGSTPAFGASVTMSRKVLRYPLPPKYRFVDDPDRDQIEGGASPTFLTLQPTEDREITSSRRDPAFSDAELKSFIESRDGEPGQVQLYCYGTLTYRDAFGRTHWSRYCRSFGGDFYARTGKGSFCHVNNDSSDSPEAPAPDNMVFPDRWRWWHRSRTPKQQKASRSAGPDERSEGTGVPLPR